MEPDPQFLEMTGIWEKYINPISTSVLFILLEPSPWRTSSTTGSQIMIPNDSWKTSFFHELSYNSRPTINIYYIET